MSTAPAISIVVPTFNRYALLKACLRSILEAEMPPVAYEIIVVDDGGALPQAIEADFAESSIKWVRLPTNEGQLNAQRTGCELARGNIVAFLDDDVEVDRQWILEIYRFFSENPDIDCVTGRVKAFDSSHILSRTRQQLYDARHRQYVSADYRRDLINKWNLSVSSQLWLSDHICEGNFTLRKHLVEAVSFFDHDLRSNVSGVMSGELLRQGHLIVYNPAMIIYHKHDTRILTLYKMAERRIFSEYGKRNDLSFRASIPFWLGVIKAPFAIAEKPEMFLADPNRVKVYLVFTAVQLTYSIGALSTFLQLWLKHKIAQGKSS